MFYKRRKIAISFMVVIAILLSLFCVGCRKDDLPPIKQVNVYEDFSVNFIDVGQGDCIFIRLSDGKNLLIDSGLNDTYSENIKYIKSILKAYSVNKIDYFVLTHPDLDHIGNANEIINKYSVGTIYLPVISSALMENFEHFKTLLDLVEEKQINKVVSDYTCYIKGEDYAFAFLTPIPKGIPDSSYSVLENTTDPTDTQINDLSPIIYFECLGKRFVFTGDASNSQEKIVVTNDKLNLYDSIFSFYGINVNLQEIDYFKVSHHGADNATSEQFLELLKPKNFIISVGKENFYGHPRSETLERILTICPQSSLYRTDEVGTITVHKNKENKIVLSTTKQN